MKGLAIIVLAVLVSAGSSAAVTSKLITSKNIKNGTIQPIDLSARTKQSFRTPPGFKTVQRVTEESPFSSGLPKTVTATCPAGSILVGGGFMSFPDNHVLVSDSAPDAGGAEAWKVTGTWDGQTLLADLRSYALCAS